MESFRDGSGPKGTLCLKELGKITEIRNLSAEEFSVKPVVLSASETLKGKFTEWLKGPYPFFLPPVCPTMLYTHPIWWISGCLSFTLPTQLFPLHMVFLLPSTLWV